MLPIFLVTNSQVSGSVPRQYLWAEGSIPSLCMAPSEKLTRNSEYCGLPTCLVTEYYVLHTCLVTTSPVSGSVPRQYLWAEGSIPSLCMAPSEKLTRNSEYCGLPTCLVTEYYVLHTCLVTTSPVSGSVPRRYLWAEGSIPSLCMAPSEKLTRNS